MARHRRFHPQPWHVVLHEGRVLRHGRGKLDAEVGGSVTCGASSALSWPVAAPQHRPGVRRSHGERSQCCVYPNMWRRKRKICHRGRHLPFFPKATDSVVLLSTGQFFKKRQIRACGEARTRTNRWQSRAAVKSSAHERPKSHMSGGMEGSDCFKKHWGTCSDVLQPSATHERNIVRHFGEDD